MREPGAEAAGPPTDVPVHLWSPWRKQIHADGFLAAMNGEPLNTFATIEWQLGFQLYVESRVLCRQGAAQ